MGSDRSVSFVITVYNKEPYIEATLLSVVGQTGDFEREIIVVDDGSTDRSPAIIGRVLQGLPNVKVLTLGNAGPSVALNAGVGAASKSFIKPVDGDDVLVRDAASRLLAGFGAPDVALVRGASVRFSGPADGFAVDRAPMPAFTVLEAPLEDAIRHSFSGCSEVMFRRQPFVACGGCDETVFIQDQSFIWRLAVDHRFAFTDEIIAVRPAGQSDTLIANRNQIEHDRNAALCGLIRDHPGLPARIKALALHRCAGRAWQWAHRINLRPWGCDAAFWIWLASYLPWLPCRARLMRACLAPYRKGGAVRFPAGRVPAA